MINSEIFSIENLDNPYPEYDRLRKESPVWWSEAQKRWVITQYKDIRFVLSDDRFSVARQISNYNQLSKEEQDELGPLRQFIDHDHTSFKADRPKHTRLKKVELECITKQSVEAMKPFIEALCNRIIDEKMGQNKMDIIADYAAPIALGTIAEYLGFPAEDSYLIRDWVKRSSDVRAMVGKYSAASRYQETTTEIRNYLTELISSFRKENRPGLIGDFIRMLDEGRLENEEELFWTIYTMMSAGHHTTLNSIANGTLSLLTNKDQLELLRENPALISTTVDEVMRYDGYVQFLDRVAKEDVIISGVTIKKGDYIAVCVGAGNRDPEAYGCPASMDITRKPNKHLSMGYATHYCSGASLGKHEVEIALQTLITRIPTMELAEKTQQWGRSFNHRYLHELSVIF